MPTKKRYYWLKLKRDFFKRHDIEIVEAMPNGKDYVLFYLKLLIESIDHEGTLRFSDTIPYDEQMISVITRTNIDIVRSAMKIFEHLNLVEIMDDKTIYLKEAAKLLGCESYSAERMRDYRKKQEPLISALHCNNNVQKSDEEIEREIDIDIEIERETKTPRAQGSPKMIFGSQKNVYLTQDELEKLKGEYKDIADEAIDFLSEYIAEKGYKSKSHYLAIRRWVIEAVKERRQRGDKKSVDKPKQNFEGVQYSDEFMKSLEADPEELLARLNKKTEERK